MIRSPSPDYLLRFGGLARLYGQESLQALNNAHFVVIGLGGVGTWVAEALARSGVGGAASRPSISMACSAPPGRRRKSAYCRVAGSPPMAVALQKMAVPYGDWAGLGVVPWFEEAWRLPAEDILDLGGRRSGGGLPRSRPGGTFRYLCSRRYWRGRARPPEDHPDEV